MWKKWKGEVKGGGSEQWSKGDELVEKWGFCRKGKQAHRKGALLVQMYWLPANWTVESQKSWARYLVP